MPRFTGYHVFLDEKIDVIATLDEKITSDILKEMKQSPRLVAALHSREGATENALILWYNKKSITKHEGILKSIYIHHTKKSMFIIGQIYFDGMPLTIVLYNPENLNPVELKCSANRGVYGKPVVLSESIKLSNCKAYIE